MHLKPGRSIRIWTNLWKGPAAVALSAPIGWNTIKAYFLMMMLGHGPATRWTAHDDQHDCCRDPSVQQKALYCTSDHFRPGTDQTHRGDYRCGRCLDGW